MGSSETLYHQEEQSAAIAECHRLSRELHDSVTQSLYNVTMFAEVAARLLREGDAATAAEYAMMQVMET